MYMYVCMYSIQALNKASVLGPFSPQIADFIVYDCKSL